MSELDDLKGSLRDARARFATLVETLRPELHRYAARQGLSGVVDPARVSVGDPAPRVVIERVTVDGREYHRLDGGQYIPLSVYEQVRDRLGAEPMPSRGEAVYQRYVEQRFLAPYIAVPVFIVVFLLVLYLLGRFLAFSVGRFLWSIFESVIGRLPLVRNVYSSVKQVTDFVFSEREIQYTRVVAVEYPRKGMWSVGLVTGESLPQLRELLHEPLLAVTLPCSPAPMAARSITVRKKDVVDLNMTVDQALQFIISCGVVVPPHQH
jgi:uncharacterized membrane protein